MVDSTMKNALAGHGYGDNYELYVKALFKEVNSIFYANYYGHVDHSVILQFVVTDITDVSKATNKICPGACRNGAPYGLNLRTALVPYSKNNVCMNIYIGDFMYVDLEDHDAYGLTGLGSLDNGWGYCDSSVRHMSNTDSAMGNAALLSLKFGAKEIPPLPVNALHVAHELGHGGSAMHDQLVGCDWKRLMDKRADFVRSGKMTSCTIDSLTSFIEGLIKGQLVQSNCLIKNQEPKWWFEN